MAPMAMAPTEKAASCVPELTEKAPDVPATTSQEASRAAPGKGPATRLLSVET